MQLVDRKGVFKDWNTLKHKYDLQNNWYFQQMQLIVSYNLIGKMSLNKITIPIRLRQHSIIIHRNYTGYL